MKIQTLKKANKKQIASLALLHQEVLTESFLCRFGYRFLCNVYKALCPDENNIIQIITSKDKIIGYSAASKDTTEFYKRILYKNFFGLSLEILKNLRGNLKLVLNILFWILTFKKHDRYPAELQFLAILPKYQRHGLGTKLIDLLKKEYAKNNIASFKVGTKAENFQANTFYKKNGFKYLYRKKILGEKINYYISDKAD